MSSLVAVALVLSIWVSTRVSISSVLIQSLTGYTIVRGGGIYLFFFVISVGFLSLLYTLRLFLFKALLSATCGTCYVPLL